MNITKHYQKVRDVKVTPEDLIAFEDKVKYGYENAQTCKTFGSTKSFSCRNSPCNSVLSFG